MKKVLSILLIIGLAVSVIGCSSSEQTQSNDNNTSEENVVAVGFAQSRMNHPYRVAAVNEFKSAVEERNLDWKVIVCDGQNDTAKQTSDVEDLITQDVDVIVMSPITADALAPVAKKVMEAEIPLVLLDRNISTNDYTSFVGGDNKMIGKIVADDIAKRLNGKPGNIVELQGTLGASATTDRHEGFIEQLEQYPNLNVIADVSGEYDRAKALSIVEDLIQAGDEISAIYCHNDAMAMGAMTALQAAGINDVLIYGADGTKEVFDEIKKGTITGTAFYPTGSTKAVEVVQEILEGKIVEKSYYIEVPLVTEENVDQYYDRGI